ncbi:Deoxyguanosinetriphosphate triphosphohydrolase-like protein [Candidatus Methanoperedenaceae archaeon GB50]|nr:Deoxyguanosinetriphosphate triphosphohydrolase-like protein [Candidatus Methanoperedenaceae archaeon GB37]CAD7768905.1 Deoxyguanosinetriphosphate triphosphohydrolase-like protein [Candidatus Methanoperedenaceae archaeon GB50]
MKDLEEILKSRVIVEKDYEDSRSPFLRDRDRIIFSRAFRRLGFKTQVVASSGRTISDHIRNRLTHSLEVMQIASSIALEVNKELKKKKRLDIDLIQAITLGHDIGHTPYGHIGEEALFEFIFNSEANNLRENFGDISNKARHNFQSLKVCCFLEKQYKPDFYGLNLTIATLDGILKHSFLKEGERKLYQDIFNSYQKVFWEESTVNINPEKKEKLNELLFEYVSPLTIEGIIVSIADEIAQLCHDIEDLRRLGEFRAVKDFYESVVGKIRIINSDLTGNAQKVYGDFTEYFEEVKKRDGEVSKLERLYVKLILTICIPIVTKAIRTVHDMDEFSQEQLLKKKYMGRFENLKELKSELGLNESEVRLIKSLEKIFKEYENTLIQLPDVARWDIKGKELCKELSDKLYEAFIYTKEQKNDINLNIIDPVTREDLKKSYYAGKEFERLQENLIQKEDRVPIKFAIWDHLASMTDSFIIKQYELLTFKHVELR